MNSQLMAKKPADISNEDWEKMWNNASYILQPLAEVLKQRRAALGTIKATDFDVPNHYAKLVTQLGQKDILNEVLALLPDTVDK